jgi:uncharacterized Zn-binding protein involved in type VI secretion
MGRPFIVLGDQTDHGGQVIEATGVSDTHGKRLARVGDKVSCPKKGHGHTTVIVSGDPTMIIDGQPAARHGDKCACGATLIASQGVSAAGSAAAGGSKAVPNVAGLIGVGLAQAQPLKPRPQKTFVTDEPQFKIFWQTARPWAPADVLDYQKQVPSIAERLRTEQYWNKNGEIKSSRFTCEDFAIRILCEYAKQHGLPIKLTTGVRTYKNVESYRANEHERYASNVIGFAEMVMLTFGASDVQRVGSNSIAVAQPEDLRSGDLLAQVRDRQNRAHHIQVVFSKSDNQIDIYQGNSGAGNWASAAYRLVGTNPADPKDESYTGKPVEIGQYRKATGTSWDYTNKTSGTKRNDFLKNFEFFRWNFMEFNK